MQKMTEERLIEIKRQIDELKYEYNENERYEIVRNSSIPFYQFISMIGELHYLVSTYETGLCCSQERFNDIINMFLIDHDIIELLGTLLIIRAGELQIYGGFKPPRTMDVISLSDRDWEDIIESIKNDTPIEFRGYYYNKWFDDEDVYHESEDLFLSHYTIDIHN